MATILKAYGWESGRLMVPSVDASYTDWTVSGSYAHTGSYGIHGPNHVDAWLRFQLDGTPSNPSVSLWLYIDQAIWDNDRTKFRFLLDTGEWIDIVWNHTTKTFDAYVDGALVADGSYTVQSYNAWVQLQIYVVVSDTGSIIVKTDGHSCISYSGDTKPQTATTGVTYFYLWETYTCMTVDDLVIGYGGLLGDLRCYDLVPNADTVQADWTPSAGSDRYALLDEVPPNDADYVSTATNAAADELELEDLTGADKAPVAVVAWVRAKADDAVGASIKVGVDSGGVDDTETHALSTSWEYYMHTMDVNPADGLEWEADDIAALKLRYEAVLP